MAEGEEGNQQGSSSAFGGMMNSESFIVDTKKPLRQFYPNQFYKVCAPLPKNSGGSNNNNNNGRGRLGLSPMCGDGTQFCFYVSRPPQRSLNSNKLIVELMGGGACWDADTCEQQASYLTLSDQLDNALGRSCQEVQAGMNGGNGDNNDGGNPVNMICSGSLGGTDMTKYNTIVVPYCTQDIHLGDRTITYDDGTTVYHHGGHNTIVVLNWIYRNFPRLQHAVVTGCSAGGTAVPVVQAMLDKQYNHFGSRQLQTAAIADSPVYLTPQYFLQHGIQRWNPQSILNKLGLPYQRFASSTDYPTRMWDFILRKGNNRDRWGFVSHTSDPVSLIYYEYMSGAYANDNNNGGDDDDGANNNNNGNGDDAVADDDNANNNNRRLANNNGNDDDANNNNNNNGDDDNNAVDYETEWYSELTESISYIQNRHPNVHSYWLDSQEGHCSFGLYYGLSEGGSSFESFLSPIVKEDTMLIRPAVNAFLVSSAMGFGLILLLLYNRRRRIYLQHDDASTTFHDGLVSATGGGDVNNMPPKITNFNSNLTVASTTSTMSRWTTFKSTVLEILQKWESYPVTVGYTTGMTLYFLCMIIQQGFAHPMNNPSLGPSALGLSTFGILNPSLVVYQGQWFRLLTTNFVVSGVITYAVAILYLLVRMRPLEKKMGTDFKSPWLFVTLAVLVATIINFVYCFVPTRFGASCTSLAMLMGMQTCHLSIYRNAFVRPYLSIAAVVFDLFLVSLIFPFNSWIMMTTSIFAGLVLSPLSKRLDEFLPAGIKINVVGAHSGKSLQSEIELFGQHSTEEEDEQSTSYETMDERRASQVVMSKQRKKRTKAVFCACLAFIVCIIIPLIISVAASPRRLYEDSFYTGCKLFYTDQIDDLSSSFLSDDDKVDHEEGEGDHRRSLLSDEDPSTSIISTFMDAVADGIQPLQTKRRTAEGEEHNNVEYSCAQFCVPHLISPLFQTVARHRGLPISRGQCTDNGYSTHVLDKTFSGFSYSLDVELYTSSNNNNNNGGNKRS